MKCFTLPSRRLSLLAAGLLLAACAQAALAEDKAALPAFPGAQGYGSSTPGGRGGRVIEVTNLNADGPGSFREACEAEGPRIIVFRIGGTIRLTKDLVVSEPYATIAAQTAPGDGICVRGVTFVVAANDVIVRGLRVRTGDDPEGPYPEARDGLCIGRYGVEGISNVIVDHCSVSWAIDENMSTTPPAHDVTVQWCINSEALWESIHPKGSHSKGFLVFDRSRNVTVHHSLFAHNNTRNPLLKGGTTSEVINNLVYNWGTQGIALTDPENTGPYKSNIIGNYFIPGDQLWCPAEIILEDAKDGSSVYIKGNIGPKRPDDSMDELACVHFARDSYRDFYVTAPAIEPSGVTVQPAAVARNLILANAGAVTPRRDAADERVVQSILNRTGELIDWAGDVGGWPELKNGPAPADSDHDGMPDEWETAHGLDPNDPSDGPRAAPSGYTWVEEYINSLIRMPNAEQ
jgi:pectate lyase